MNTTPKPYSNLAAQVYIAQNVRKIIKFYHTPSRNGYKSIVGLKKAAYKVFMNVDDRPHDGLEVSPRNFYNCTTMIRSKKKKAPTVYGF